LPSANFAVARLAVLARGATPRAPTAPAEAGRVVRPALAEAGCGRPGPWCRLRAAAWFAWRWLRPAVVGRVWGAGWGWLPGSAGARRRRAGAGSVSVWYLRLTRWPGSHILNDAPCSGAVRHGPAQPRLAV